VEVAVIPGAGGTGAIELESTAVMGGGLLHNKLIMRNLSLWAPLLYVGVFAATLSSALVCACANMCVEMYACTFVRVGVWFIILCTT
jgi:hypothetical protein